VRWLEVDEQARVLDAATIQRGDHKGEPGPLHLAIVVALCTDMRRGEILALRRTDLDFAHDRISVRRGQQWNPDGRLTYRASDKNCKGRVIATPATLMPCWPRGCARSRICASPLATHRGATASSSATESASR
jgi:integrase